MKTWAEFSCQVGGEDGSQIPTELPGMSSNDDDVVVVVAAAGAKHEPQVVIMNSWATEGGGGVWDNLVLVIFNGQ